jgi:CRP-like cAMP-binding protein
MSPPLTLRRCPLFQGLDEHSFELLEAVTRPVHFAKDERIFSHGDRCPGIYVVESGLVRVYQLSPQGKRHVLHFAEPDGSFAEVAAIGRFPCPAHADAAKKSECLLLPSAELQHLLSTQHELCQQLLVGMARWVRSFVHLLEDVVLRDASARVAAALLELGDGEGELRLPMQKQDLASHLNLTSETFSRTLRRFEEMGLIATAAGQRLRILQREQLASIAAEGTRA